MWMRSIWTRRMWPVSYTHLDVYKRQMMNHALDGGMSHMAVLRMLAANESNEGPVTWLRLLGLWRPVAVSYTHLDVYKRQEWEWLLPALIAMVAHLVLEPLGLGRGGRTGRL